MASGRSTTPTARRCGDDLRLLLVDYDDLVELWDALLPHEASFDDPGSYGLEVTRRLRERVGDLMAVTFDDLKQL